MDDRVAEAHRRRRDQVRLETARLKEKKDALMKQAAQLEGEKDLIAELTVSYKLLSSELEESLRTTQASRVTLQSLNREARRFNEEVNLTIKRQKIQTDLYKSACVGALWETDGLEDEEVLQLVEGQLAVFEGQAAFIDRASEAAVKAYHEQTQLISQQTRRLAGELTQMQEGRKLDLSEWQSRRRKRS
jgi:hypothetical protein